MKRNILFIVLLLVMVGFSTLSFYYFREAQKKSASIASLSSEKQNLEDSLVVLKCRELSIIQLVDSLSKGMLGDEDTYRDVTLENIRESLYQIADHVEDKQQSINKLQSINFQFAKDLIAEKKKYESLDSVYNKDNFVWQQQKNNFLARLEREEMTKQTIMNSRDSILASFGKLIYKNVAGIEVTYVGNKVNNKADGFGIGLYAAKGTYVGFWQNGRRHGEGMYKWLNGDKYEGNYNQGTREGFGIYYFSDGSRFEGEWKNDQRNGEGVFYSAENKILAKGIWKDDRRLNAVTEKKPLLPEAINTPS